MDLKEFVGKRVLVQFKPGVSYAVVTDMGGRPAPLIVPVKREDGSEGRELMIVPYIDGKVEEGGVIVYGDQGPEGKGKTLRLHIAPEMIFTVTECPEPARILTL